MPIGEVTSFPRSVQAKRGETVVLSWIVFKSRAHRDRVNAKVMKDPRMADMMDPKEAPFDSKRMIYGGFDVFVDVKPARCWPSEDVQRATFGPLRPEQLRGDPAGESR